MEALSSECSLQSCIDLDIKTQTGKKPQSRMGGPFLEGMRFGLYLFLPIGFMYYFNLPEFHDKHVRTVKFYPDRETLNQPPRTTEEAKQEFRRLLAQAEERCANRAAGNASSKDAPSS